MSARRQARLTRRRIPAVLVSGIDENAMLATSISLQFGLPRAVSVRHLIDAEQEVLVRIVSDVNGIVEQEEINLAHACVTCAIREDIVPTLERLARMGKWAAIVACLPVTAEADQVCRAIAWAPGVAPHVTIAAVVTALDGASVSMDLLGDELLAERGLATTRDDQRGAAEVACGQVEYADIVCLTEEPDEAELALVQALARPRTRVLTDPTLLDAPALLAGAHRHREVEAWVTPVRRGGLPPLPELGVHRLDLCSDKPLHPQRFLDELSAIGDGPFRSRGCFWVPTRPDVVCEWNGAGGQVSVGTTDHWHGTKPLTRIVVTGLDQPTGIAEAFERALLTDAEIALRGTHWDDGWDGLEPWLGPIERVA